MSTVITVLRCPECGAAVRESVNINGFRAASTTIGPPTMLCPACGCELITGLSEWADKSPVERAWFFVRLALWSTVSGLVVAGGGGAILAFVLIGCGVIDEGQYEACSLVFLCLGSSLLAGMLVRNARCEIRQSLARSRGDLVTHHRYQPGRRRPSVG